MIWTSGEEGPAHARSRHGHTPPDGDPLDSAVPVTGAAAKRRASGRKPASLTTRIRRRARRAARAFAAVGTPVQVALIAVFALSLVVAIVAEELLHQIVGVVTATAALVALLALINRRLARAGSVVIGAAGPTARSATAVHRAIGGSEAIVSVIIPGKNEAAYARDCIWSLKHQTLTNFEAIVIDDGSTDATLDVVLDEIKGDPRFHVIRTAQSVGIGLARNLGVQRAVGKYVTFLDLDDFVAPDALTSRVELAERHADMPWVAGAYCWHETVDTETRPKEWQPPKGVARPPISWLTSLDDAMFIASAPLMRRDAFLAVGGFDDAPTAEDQVFWFKLLRWGFVMVATDTVGVAYRRKPTSHAVATAVAMRDTITRLLLERSERAPVPPGQRGPFFFSEGIGRYQSLFGYTRRTAAALGIAVANGSPDTVINALVADFEALPFPFVGWAVDIRELALGGLRRVTRARGEHAREAAVLREVERLVHPLIDAARSKAAAWISSGENPTLPVAGTVRNVRQPKLLQVTPLSLRSFSRTGRPVLLLPSSAYHTDELIELVDELRSRGFAPLAMLNEKRWATTGSALARVDVHAVTALPAGDWLLDFAALLTFNDWGEYYHDYVEYLRGKPPVSFAKVEGVQDWLDHDTGRVRNPYLAADVVLCQGENDVVALQDRRGRLEVIGSDRLEAIWNSPLPADRPPRVVGNVNFTYGVQSEHRDLWVETLRQACEDAGVPLDLSLHPSETAKFPGLASPDPIRHLMVTDSILVSRFSTVLFEGMARGCSVIYYNPHGERVPTFHHPEGAFDIAEDPQTLARHIAAAKARSRAAAKERASAFFERQVSMIPGQPVSIRTADAIERNLGEPATVADSRELASSAV